MVKFEAYPKQQEFIDACFSGKYKFLFYGGAAGGGKSYVGLAILITLCKLFPGSRWCVIRKDATKLEKNTITTFRKLCPSKFLVKLVDGTAHFTNGSQILFIGENYYYDKDLTWMDGFEVNGFVMEEAQELNARTFEKAKLRAGRHIISNMPPILIIITGNPSQNWSKSMFVDPYKKGELEAPYYFLPALMTDNPYLPEEYKESLKSLDSITYQRYVLGNWDIIDVDKPFAYGFDPKRHIGQLKKPNKGLPLLLSFDFNVDPITAIVAQTNNKDFMRIHKEYRLKNSNIYELCKAIKQDHPDYYFNVTGDASGQSRSAMVRDNLTYYKIIQNELGLSAKQMLVPSVNPLISNNRVLVNSVLEKYPSFIIDESCEYLIKDLQYCEVNRYGEIDKTKDKHMSHLLDTLRYLINTFMFDWLKYKL